MTETQKIFTRTRITVPEGERALVLVNGRFDAICTRAATRSRHCSSE